jgi:hypothetical protein
MRLAQGPVGLMAGVSGNIEKVGIYTLHIFRGFPEKSGILPAYTEIPASKAK